MKTLFLILIAVLAAVNMLDAVRDKSRLAFSFASDGFKSTGNSLRSLLNWDSKVSYMKAKFGAIVVDGRGKIGGHVASKNRSGSYFRTKVTPVNRNTSFQAAVRNRLASISQGWRSLTQAQITAWNAAVADFSKTNIFGDVVQPTGFNLYQALNNNLARIEGTPLVNPPTPAAVDDILIGALTATADDGAISLAYTPGSGGSMVEIYATAPLSAGVSFVKSEFRLLGAFASDSAGPFVATTMYAEKFGAITGATGKKIFVKTVAINDETGQSGIAQQTSCIIAAS